MEIIKLGQSDPSEALSKTVSVLEADGIAIVPTDTIYGIIGKANSEIAINKIRSIKKRETGKPLPVFISDLAMAEQYAEVPPDQLNFLKQVWPGSFTIVLRQKTKEFPENLTGGRNTIGLRVPNRTFLIRLVREINAPLVQSSANLSGQPPAKNVDEVKKHFGDGENQIDLVIDGGDCDGKPSKVIDLSGTESAMLRE
jgi:L-threonylcarbamoyladenylate synthase